jgi:chondroitin AC lyase
MNITRPPALRRILNRLRGDALYNKQDVIVDCGWYSGVGIREPGDRHYLSQPPDYARVREWIETQAVDGSWPEIPYTSAQSDEFGSIAPQTHLCWLLAMAEAYHHRHSPLRKNPRLLRAILRGFDFWLTWDFRHASWWWLMIGVPRWLYKIVALMETHLSPDQFAQACGILARADALTPWGLSLQGTAQNQVWAAENILALGCLEGSPERVRKAVGLIAGEIVHRPGWGEGIQADYSFHQHGNTLYSGGYGFYFAVDVPRLAVVLKDTDYALPPQALETIARYVLDHQQWIVRGLSYAYTVVGREIVRPGKNAWLLPATCRSLLRLPLGPATHKAVRRFADRLAGVADDLNKPRFAGNRMFWRSDFMAHQRPNFHASVKLHSRRLLNTDTPCNKEGLQNHHLSDGAFCLMQQGQEYTDVFPAWDWRKIPGTTALQPRQPLSPDTPIPTFGRRDFAGGVSDGVLGCAGYDFAHSADPRGPDQLVARKSWFFFFSEIACLGAGISASAPDPVVTTLNQSRLNGPVTWNDGTRSVRIKTGRFQSPHLHWVHHDQTAYLLLAPGAGEGSAGPVSGDWHRINEQMPSRSFRENIFYLGLRHGIRPQDAAYAYAIFPGRSVEQAAQLANTTNPIEILANSTERQAVRHGETGVIQAIFYGPGHLHHAEGWSIQVDRPCAFQLRPCGLGRCHLSVASPDQTAGRIHIHLQFYGHDKTHALRLPSGVNAGRSVTRIL